ncbi:MAG: UDP-N-acetylmuramoyl-tripeptide--D-alanyl-D-alanine ligase [Bacteroidetes bacterium]|nr:MAG: UDP-N-acetylmuramoyl-tripeptide--D-alanyl-D-alanine ligase [Bacteroidota bacterium]
MNISDLYNIFLKYPNICTDSRKLIDNSIFFALKGENFDGNRYAIKALDRCKFAVVDEEEFAIDERFILVDDVLFTLQELAKYHREKLDLSIIAITGTNGKTTTKELINTILDTQFEVVATNGNFNNHIGVPITLLKMNKKTDIGVVEMGANHIGEIKELCEIAKPNYGIITNVGKAHLEGFGSFEGVKKAKSELYKFLSDNKGLAFINNDNEILEDLNPPSRVIFYGSTGFNHCQGKLLNSDLHLKFKWVSTEDMSFDDEKIDWNKKTREINTKIFGDYNFENALAAACVANHFGISELNIKKAIEDYIPINNRSQLIKKQSNTIILDAYNANPTSMKIAIEGFANKSFENKTIILGDMLELGSKSVIEHTMLLSLVASCKFDKVFLIGDNFFSFKEKYSKFNWFVNIDDFISSIKNNPIKSSTILIKGSRKNALEKLIEYL